MERKSNYIINKLSNELLNDREIILLASEKGCKVLQYIKSNELLNDREIVLNCARNYGRSRDGGLQFTSIELKNDREIVLNCIKHDGSALQYASIKLRNDREIVLEAIKNSGRAFKYASAELKKDLELILIAGKTYPEILKHLSNELKSDREFALKCIKINGECFESILYYFPKQWESDIEIMNEAIKQNLLNAVYIMNDDKMMNNCKNAILNSIDKLNLKYAFDIGRFISITRRINDLDIIIKLIETNPFYIHFVNEEFKSNNKELLYKTTLLHSGYWMKFSEDAFQQRINHSYYSAKIDSTHGGNEINYYRNLNKEHLLWEDCMEWKKWEQCALY